MTAYSKSVTKKKDQKKGEKEPTHTHFAPLIIQGGATTDEQNQARIHVVVVDNLHQLREVIAVPLSEKRGVGGSEEEMSHKKKRNKQKKEERKG